MDAMPIDGHADTLGADLTSRATGDRGSAQTTVGTDAAVGPRTRLPTVGEPLGDFTLLARLGEGGMGVVYAAWSHKLARRVAIKLPTRGLDDEARARIVREARSLAQVDHPNVVQIYEIGEQDGVLFIAMELVEGATLKQWQSDAARGWREILAMYLQAGRGLAAAHRQGLLHRDFKPSNTLVDREGRVRLIDFGLARMRDQSQDIAPTVEGVEGDERSGPEFVLTSRCGTPRYMAPELYETGATVDARSDQFSFCVALWEALFGELPDFQRTVPRDAPRRVPAWLVRLLRRGLAYRREDRFPAMDALLADLERGLHPPRRPLTVAALSGALAASAGAVFAARTHEGACPAPSALAASLWSPEQRAALDSSGSSAMSVEPWLSNQVDAWAEARADACRRGDALAGPARARAELCLGERRRALADVAAAAAAGATAGRDAARWDAQLALWDRALAPARDCVDPVYLAQPFATAVRGDLSEISWLEDQLMTGAALVRSGDPAAAEPALELARARAGALGDPWRRARAEVELGVAAFARGDETAARSRFEAATAAAEAAGDDFLAADAWRWLVFVDAARGPAPRDALVLLPHAEGKLRRIGQDGGPRMVDLQLSAAWAELRAGDLDNAHRRLAAALARTSGVDEALAARVLRHHAERAHQRGEHPAAIDFARQALALQLRRDGPDARSVADTRQSLARYELAAGMLPEAEADLRAALAVAADDPDPRERASLRTHLAVLLYTRGDLAAARAAADEAAAEFAAVRDPHAGRADRIALAELAGDLSLESGDPRTALRRYAEGLALAADAAALPEVAANALAMRVGQAAAHHRLGDLAAAHATITAVLADLAAAPASVQAYALGTAAEIEHARGDLARAQARCAEALARVPADDPLAAELRTLATRLRAARP